MSTRTSSVCSAVLIALAFLASAYLYPRLPVVIPTHWNLQGEADSFSPKSWAVWLAPGLMILMFVLFRWVLPAISPGKFDLGSFRPIYNLIVVGLMALLLVVHFVSLRQALDEQTQGGRILMATIFLFFAFMGNVTGKIRRNFWMGIRVPWTIASERVWNDTHRLASWIWVAAGLLGAVLVWINLMTAAWVLLVAAILIPVVYSFMHYKTLERRGELEHAS